MASKKIVFEITADSKLFKNHQRDDGAFDLDDDDDLFTSCGRVQESFDYE